MRGAGKEQTEHPSPEGTKTVWMWPWKWRKASR